MSRNYAPTSATGGQFESDNTGTNQYQTDQASEAGRLLEQQNAQCHHAHRTDTDPYRVSRAQGRPQSGETFGLLQAHRPANFERARNNKDGPIHQISPDWGRPRLNSRSEVVLTPCPIVQRQATRLYVISSPGCMPAWFQANTRKRCSSSMKVFSPKPASLEPNGICARSVQDAGMAQVFATAASTTGL